MARLHQRTISIPFVLYFEEDRKQRTKETQKETYFIDKYKTKNEHNRIKQQRKKIKQQGSTSCTKRKTIKQRQNKTQKRKTQKNTTNSREKTAMGTQQESKYEDQQKLAKDIKLNS